MPSTGGFDLINMKSFSQVKKTYKKVVSRLVEHQSINHNQQLWDWNEKRIKERLFFPRK